MMKNVYLLHGDYISTSSAQSGARVIHYNAGFSNSYKAVTVTNLHCYGVNMKLECNTDQSKKQEVVAVDCKTSWYKPASIVIEKSTIECNGHNNTVYGIKTGGVDEYTIILKDSTIIVTSDSYVGSDANDSTAIGIYYDSPLKDMLIEGCVIDATNYAVGTLLKGMIRNSILSGGVHGGLYDIRLGGRGFGSYSYGHDKMLRRYYINYGDDVYPFIQNCTIKRVNKNLQGDQYPYACYISGNIWFDGCTFENEVEGGYKAPAIKKQSGQTASPMPYFSNCEMGDNIRIDEGCNAYFGKGMRRDMTVVEGTGTLHYTDDTYASIPVVTTVYVNPIEETTTTSETSSS